jgi:hypothetical protein
LVETLIQTRDALTLLDDNCRPWGKLHPGCSKAIKICDDIENLLADRKAALRIPLDRKDRVACKEVLLCVMKLFGEGTHDSPQRTMGHCLEVPDGSKCAESKVKQWEKDRAEGLLCHNNASERPSVS